MLIIDIMLGMWAFILLPLMLLVLHKMFQIMDRNTLKKLCIKYRLWKAKKKTPRFWLHDPTQFEDLKKLGMLAQEEEWQMESPHPTKDEDVTITGFNSWGQSIILNFKWRPQADQNSSQSVLGIDLAFNDGKGNIYTMNEVQLVPRGKYKREYRGRGVSLEILFSFRRLRIKCRGFMKKNDEPTLVFIKFRLLFIVTSNVFDFKFDHDSEFLVEEMVKKGSNLQIKFEDCFEQMGQIKGIIQIEDEKEEELYMWGSKRKRYSDDGDWNVKRLFGYSKQGLAFHIGSVEERNSGVCYRYGIAFYGKRSIYPVLEITDTLDFQGDLADQFAFNVRLNGRTFKIKGDKSGNNSRFTNKQFYNIKINSTEGQAIYLCENNIEQLKTTQPKVHVPYDKISESMVLSLLDKEAETEVISGGKGASLCSLCILANSKETKNTPFYVPKGIVVTTNAYQKMLSDNVKIRKEIEKLLCFLSKPDQLEEECQKVVKLIQSKSLPQSIREQIKNVLSTIYTQDDFGTKLFAVRSSATGEDSEEMSAAGQMTTYLAVKGLDEICLSVMKCWSSQFNYIAVEYKRGYGQEINSPMAVVVQEMIDPDVAGVTFTCDPVSGDEREIIITANYGIGESVVSGMAEPDTIRLKVKINNNGLLDRQIEGIKMIEIGSKAKIVKVKDSLQGGTYETQENDSSKCSLSEVDAIKIGTVALKVQNFYGNVRDIEWAIKEWKIYLLQSRPITNLDTNFTEWEIMHEIDDGNCYKNVFGAKRL